MKEEEEVAKRIEVAGVRMLVELALGYEQCRQRAIEEHLVFLDAAEQVAGSAEARRPLLEVAVVAARARLPAHPAARTAKALVVADLYLDAADAFDALTFAEQQAVRDVLTEAAANEPVPTLREPQ